MKSYPVLLLTALLSVIMSAIDANRLHAENEVDAEHVYLENFCTVTTPILIGEQGTVVQKIDFHLSGEKLPGRLQADLTLQNTGILESAALSVNGRKYPIALSDGKQLIEAEAEFEPGEQTVALLLQPKAAAALSESASGGITNLRFAGRTLVVDAAPRHWPVGHLLVAPGQMGVHTFRIPGMVKSKQGTLLAVYDFRYQNSRDLPADIDVGLSRSTDDGQTWEEPRVIMNFGTGDPKEGAGDPAILVDDRTGRVWVAALWAHGGHSLATSKSGLIFGESGQLVLCYSDDDGVTWSKPRNITREIGQGKDWRIVFNGPGCGITMRDGTLVFAAQYWDAKNVPHSTILYSRDRGESWHIGTGARSQTTEAQVVELADGSLMLNMRDNRGGFRAVAVTKDLGQTWVEHPTSRSALPESVCQASLIRVTPPDAKADQNVLAFFNPHVQRGRYDMTLQLSDDDGMTWSRKRLVYSPDCYGYSSMAMLDDETLGVLYETQGGLIFQRIVISEKR